MSAEEWRLRSVIMAEDPYRVLKVRRSASLDEIKKNRKPGPASYNTEPGFKRLSTTERAPITQFSGLGMFVGAKTDLKHVDKLKAKSNRFLD